MLFLKSQRRRRYDAASEILKIQHRRKRKYVKKSKKKPVPLPPRNSHWLKTPCQEPNLSMHDTKNSTLCQSEKLTLKFTDGICEIPLPCLYSNISTEGTLGSQLTPQNKKQIHALYENSRYLINTAKSVGHIGFLTLTFQKNIKDAKKASKCFNSLNNHFIRKDPRFLRWISVRERQQRGAWHYHLLIELSEDIRTGFDFEAVALGNYDSVSPYLRSLWSDLRKKVICYGFGKIVELKPIQTSCEQVSRYMAKYMSKHFEKREERDKGVRLVSYSQCWRKCTTNFAWNTENSRLWRENVKRFAHLSECENMDDLKRKYGGNWAYIYADVIMNIDEIAEKFLAKIPF